MKYKIYQELFDADAAFSITLLTTMMDEFGTDFVTWTPITLAMEIREVFHVVPQQHAMDKLMAGISILTSNSFYTSLPDFNQLCLILSGEPLTPGMFVPADAAACAWGITEAHLISPPDQEWNFTDEIKAYVGKTLQDEGIMTVPSVLANFVSGMDEKAGMKVGYDYTDDPEMFGAIFKAEKSKTDNIDQFVKKRLTALIEQLMQLSLKVGNVQVIAEKMLSVLPAESE